jgi:uncharacterized protein
MKIQLVEKDHPKIRTPTLLCGLPGSGYVGKFALDHMVSELEAKPLAEIYTDGFPPQIIVKTDGSVSLLRSELYFWVDPKGKRDLLFFTGDAQPSTPESEYALSEYVLDTLIREHKPTEMITLGAFATGTQETASKVYSAATDLETAKKLSELGCVLMKEGGITGMNGLLLGIAKLKGLRGYTLLGETSGYTLDPKASENVMKMLSKILEMPIDLTKLEKRAKIAQDMLQALDRTRQQEQVRQTVDRRKLGYIS